MKRAALLAAAALAALLVEGADAQEVLGWHPSAVLSAAYSPDGKTIASGVYFARIQAGSFSETRRMVLLK